MKRLLTLCCIMVCLFAGSKRLVGSNRGFEIKVHNINQVEMCISNFGKFAQSAMGGPGCWWPKGSGHTYIYGAGLWFGTIDLLSCDTIVTVGYGPHGGETEFGPGLSGMPVSHPDAIIYMAPDNWPPPDSTFPMAPQIPISHQDSWCCFNDSDSVYHMPDDTRPIGIEVYQTVYDWNIPAIEDIIFMTYELKNVSGHGLRDCYIGIVFDAEIAFHMRTAILEKPYYIGSNLYIVDDLAYAWTCNDSSPGIGTVGFDLLQTPFDLQPGQDKDNDGILDQYERDSAYYVNNLPPQKWDIDNDCMPDWRDASENPQLEMTAFKRFTLNLEPNKDNERYLTLAGYNFRTGKYEPYDTTAPEPEPRERALMSSGPFNIAPESTITIVFAVVLADYGTDATPPAETCLVLTDYWAQYVYNMSWHIFSIEETKHANKLPIHFAIYPNPVIQNGTVSFTLPKPGLISLKLYNLPGQLVKEIFKGYNPAGSYNIKFDTHGLAQGTYFLVLETEEGNAARSLIVLR